METISRDLGFKEILVSEITNNTFSMFAKDWALVSAGTAKNFNTMTIGWGDFGILYNIPIVTVYISSSRYTKHFMDTSKIFTVEFFGAQHKDALSYLGSHSGKDSNKVSSVGFTPLETYEGGVAFKEGNLIIEAGKIYSHELQLSALPRKIQQWYEYKGIGMHTMYIGEIQHVWKKI